MLLHPMCDLDIRFQNVVVTSLETSTNMFTALRVLVAVLPCTGAGALEVSREGLSERCSLTWTSVIF